jgi:hypothetical protein
VAPFVTLPGRDGRLFSLNVSPGHRAEPPSPAEPEHERCAVLEVWFAALRGNEARASEDVLRGESRVRAGHSSCWGGVFIAQYRDMFGWPPGSLPKGPSHRPPLRAAPQSVWPSVPATVLRSEKGSVNGIDVFQTNRGSWCGQLGAPETQLQALAAQDPSKLSGNAYHLYRGPAGLESRGARQRALERRCCISRRLR